MKASENDYEESEDAVLREQLGLRPIHYRTIGTDPHPDPAPCPTWCWVPRQDPINPMTHEVDTEHPFEAVHTLEPHPTIAASLYRGDHDPGREDHPRLTVPATIDVTAQSTGANAPVVALGLRRMSHPVREQRYTQRLRLTVADARELITALQYVVDLVDPAVTDVTPQPVPHEVVI